MNNLFPESPKYLGIIILVGSVLTVIVWIIGGYLIALNVFLGFLIGWINFQLLELILKQVIRCSPRKGKIILFLCYPLRYFFICLLIYLIVSLCGRNAGLAFLLGILIVKPVFLIAYYKINKRQKEVD